MHGDWRYMFDIPRSRTGFYANECPFCFCLLAGLLLYIRHLSKKDNDCHLDILYTLLVHHYCYIPGTNYLRKHIVGLLFRFDIGFTSRIYDHTKPD